MSAAEPIDRESLVDEVRRLLPDPLREERQLDGSFVIVGGDPGEVIVRISGGTVSIALYQIRWDGPCTPVVYSKRLASLNWKRLPAISTMMTLRELIESARELRRSNYRKCERCGEMTPPEGMLGEFNVCHSCGERYMGVTF